MLNLLEITPAITAIAPYTSKDAVSEWISTASFRELSGLSERTARRVLVACYSGGTWNNTALEVRYEGKALQVYGPSLPADLRDIWHKRYNAATAVQKPAPVTIPSPTKYSATIGDDYALLCWKLELIAAASQYPKGSRARGQALTDAANREHTKPDGKACTVGLSTLQAWLKTFEEEGEQGLHRKTRQESAPRVYISRDWDKACPLELTKKAEIAAHMSQHVASLWKEGAPGWPRVNQLAAPELLDTCRAAGWQDATLENCTPGRAFVEKMRSYSLVAIKEKNAKLFYDKYTPRIQRHRDGYKPGDIVIGDVHPMDVVREIDGRMVHARLISWLDVATYDIFVSVVFLEPGKGIRQEDIAKSFVDMVLAWGLPRQLRLDNGKEYKWEAMMEGFKTLAGLVGNYQEFLVSLLDKDEFNDLVDIKKFSAISRARPYNAAAKQIEHVFGILEYFFFAMMPGWIGGDRMNKRTQNVGQDPAAHTGTEAQFLADLNSCLELYRNTQQGESSPNDKIRKATSEGWQPLGVAREDLIFAFSETKKYKVKPGGIAIEDRGKINWYRADILIPLIGHTIEIRYAKWAKEAVYFIDQDGKKHAIPLANYYAQEDGEGAKEQARLNALSLQNVRQLKAGTKKMDLLEQVARVNAALPAPPVREFGTTITTIGGEAIGNALEALTLPAPVKLLPVQLQHPTEGHIIDMQPCNEEGPKPTAIDFDPMKLAPPTPETQKPNPKTSEFDPLKALKTTTE